jgi:hypothetical protein
MRWIRSDVQPNVATWRKVRMGGWTRWSESEGIGWVAVVSRGKGAVEEIPTRIGKEKEEGGRRKGGKEERRQAIEERGSRQAQRNLVAPL